MVQPQFKGQTYGEGAAQERRVQAMPTGAAPTQQRAQQAARRVAPAAPGSLTAPTARPDEPITAGADFGPGPNSAQANLPAQLIPVDQTMEQLRVLYQMFPNDDLADMISKYTETRY